MVLLYIEFTQLGNSTSSGESLPAGLDDGNGWRRTAVTLASLFRSSTPAAIAPSSDFWPPFSSVTWRMISAGFQTHRSAKSRFLAPAVLRQQEYVRDFSRVVSVAENIKAQGQSARILWLACQARQVS